MAENQKEKYLEEIEDQIRTIGVLTSGGDAPGMNAAIRAVVRTALSRGLKVRGIRRGFHGLLKEEIIDLSARDVSEKIQRGGTFLQENPEKEALCFSLGRRGYASPGNTKGAGGSFIRQRLCFRWQEYKAVWSKCQEPDAIFDVLHKPEKNGQRKLWQASFFPLVVCPHFDMEQQAHQSAQRESRRQRDDRLEVLQKEGLGDLCRHEKFQRRRQAGAHLVVEVVPVVEKGRPHIVVGGLDKARHDDEQADDLRQPRDEGDCRFQKALQQVGDVLVQVIQGRHALSTAQASRLLI